MATLSCDGGPGVSLPAAMTTAYASALALGYVLNRVLNFRSPPAATNAAACAAAVLANHLLFILGLLSGLAALGVHHHIARIVAGACEAAFRYSAMRWLVLRRTVPPE